MKFTITSAFLLALQFGTACGAKISAEGQVEDEVFWQRFMQDLDSMPSEPITATPTKAPTTEAPTPAQTSVVPTSSPSFVVTSSPSATGTTASPSASPSFVASPSPSGTSVPCNTIETVLCAVPEFSTLCELVDVAGLSEALNEDVFTLFAPINDAFDSLTDEIADELAEDDDLLRSAILYHAVPEVELRAADLVCDGTIMMASSEETTTVCTSDGIFQVGDGNTPDNYPQIIARDGVACNGIIHAIDQIILPSIDNPVNDTDSPTFTPTSNETIVPTSDECESIADVICALPQFEILCALVGDAGLVDALSGTDDYTIFAPVNSAFEALSLELADAIISDETLLQLVLLSHASLGDLFSTDLECGMELSMASGAETTTVCEDGLIFQTGPGNAPDAIPEIISTDGVACNGVIHAIDQVILPTLDL